MSAFLVGQQRQAQSSISDSNGVAFRKPSHVKEICPPDLPGLEDDRGPAGFKPAIFEDHLRVHDSLSLVQE